MALNSKQNVRLWSEKVKKGGVVAEHDYAYNIENNYGVIQVGLCKIMNTLSFYRNRLDVKEKQFNHKKFLPLYFEELIGDKKEVNIADLGAGLFSTIGDLWTRVKVNMYASDILADDFNQILNEANITPVIPIVKQEMENLTYSDDFFDIVHCVNALDHTTSPMKALSEMKRVCKPGGYIYLRHFPKVGKIEKYSGAHQWNIGRAGNEDIYIQHRDGQQFLLSDVFKSFQIKVGREWAYEPKIMIIITIKND